jgi:predicted DsbA family dithiol-disulfide isomerase
VIGIREEARESAVRPASRRLAKVAWRRYNARAYAAYSGCSARRRSVRDFGVGSDFERVAITAMQAVPVLVFSDFTCPFCYVSETMLRSLAGPEALALSYRAYELHPLGTELPAPAPWPEALTAIAEPLALPAGKPGFRTRTRKAHELAYLAEEGGRGEAAREAIFRAYWRDGRDIGRIDVLMEVASEIGLDPGLAKVTLDVDRFAPHVERDREAAARLGVEAVPAAIFGVGESAVLLLGTYPEQEVVEGIAAARRTGT